MAVGAVPVLCGVPLPCCAECRTEMEVRERGRDDITAEWRDRTELGTWDEIKFGGDAA